MARYRTFPSAPCQLIYVADTGTFGSTTERHHSGSGIIGGSGFERRGGEGQAGNGSGGSEFRRNSGIFGGSAFEGRQQDGVGGQGSEKTT
jgi:hypothetical protein